ncbi:MULTISPECIES: trehalose-6-phosphate synthase [Devosia]|jgi:trehalose 6-phosphate synthase|uniref:Trehalose-6-phosphate synthase n=1 Tax=Devosia litorisediminis TaxID=2829817 RepID=A0A942E4S5_9HYPH|nr:MULTISPECIES: trehalose-6-phosphate synthase [Devosia]MBS3847436.1 trehalose-6-phosphate synthase [Devosia litorisediminis]MCZ4347203.1 trehalose-6-phosphate synthase [Devosia neptuniae]|tara:strand:+ start:9593 stop:11008 length:1416 start_codon:yes stop_codon:yes gene_type:complete
MSRLIVVSNRTPGKGPAAGGLAVALRKTLAEREGFWFGWSGKLVDAPSTEARFEDIDGLSVAQIDLTRSDHHAYYAGFSNSILWPSFHLRLDLATIEGHWYEGYRAVNQQFARALLPLLKPDDIIWVHDYHLIPLASELRNLGARNRIGFYLHIPFPTTDALYAIPHHNELMRDLSRYDLVGMQANRDVSAFTEFADHQSPSSISGNPLKSVDFTRSETGAFPIGSDPDAFAKMAVSPAATKMIRRVERVLPDQRLILGVDRLDYSKGLPQRVEAYEKLLSNDAHFRRSVHMMQIAPPSRDSIKEYQETSDALDAICGRVMGRFAEPDWSPLTYVKRAYGQPSLAGLYRLARVGLVTPLRDGMNLVAHEFVASQDPENPGVLILSRFAGAAEIFDDAILVNPFDTDETAEALRMALDMPLKERIARWETLMAAAHKHSVDNWSHSFLERLTPSDERLSSATRDILYVSSVA